MNSVTVMRHSRILPIRRILITVRYSIPHWNTSFSALWKVDKPFKIRLYKAYYSKARSRPMKEVREGLTEVTYDPIKIEPTPFIKVSVKRVSRSVSEGSLTRAGSCNKSFVLSHRETQYCMSKKSLVL